MKMHLFRDPLNLYILADAFVSVIRKNIEIKNDIDIDKILKIYRKDQDIKAIALAENDLIDTKYIVLYLRLKSYRKFAVVVFQYETLIRTTDAFSL